MTMSVDSLFELHDDLCSKAKELMVSKNHDYRSGGGDPFSNFRGSAAFGIDPIKGIVLRMQDKMCRISTFADKGTLLVAGESAEDSIRDIINYAVLMGGMIRERQAQEISGSKSKAEIKAGTWALGRTIGDDAP